MLYGGIYMKKRLLLLASVFVACMIPLTQAFALDSANVIGCGKVSVKADCAYIEVGVEAIGQDAASAEAQSSAAEQALENAFRSYGCVTERYYNFYPAPKSYEICKTYSCKTTQTDKIEEIRKALSGISGIRIYGVRYELETPASAEHQALKLAVEDAESKAKALDADLSLVSVRETGCWQCQDDGCTDSATITVEVRVEARFSKNAKNTKTADTISGR